MARGELAFVYGDYVDGGPEWDFDVEPSMVEASMTHWHPSATRPTALWPTPARSTRSAPATRSVRWNLQKLVGEYARHNGHADIVRERIDGSTGE